MSKLVSIKYIGALSPIDVPLAGLRAVAASDVVEVPAEVAGRPIGDEQAVGTAGLVSAVDVLKLAPAHHFTRLDEHAQWWSHDPGEGLLAQGDNWVPAPPAKSKSTTETGA